EAGCDAEEMDARRLVLEPVEDRAQLVLFEAGACGQHRHGVIGRGERLLSCEIELRAVTGRKAHRFACVARELAGNRRGLVALQGDPLSQLDGCDAMRDADQEQRHEKWVSGRPRRTTTTSANPARTR